MLRATRLGAWALAAIAGLVLLALVFLTVADVVARYFFNAPIEGVFDLTQLGMVIVAFFGLAYTADHGGHVAIELITRFLSARASRWLAAAGDIVGAGLFLIIAWRMVLHGNGMIETGEASNLLFVPFFPFLWVGAAGCAALAIVLLVRAAAPRPAARATDDVPRPSHPRGTAR